MNTNRYGQSRLTTFCLDILRAVQVPGEEARITTEILIAADLRGVSSHGVAMLPVYIGRIMKGEISPEATIRVIKACGGTKLIDGGNGLGQVVAFHGMTQAIEGARRHGVSTVGLRGSNHFGMAAYFAMMPIPHDMIGIVLTVSNISTMAPWGGLDVLLGNNPIAIGIPASGFPLVYDAALSVAARRKIHMAAAARESIPEGWAIDSEGHSTTDAKKALAGVLLPIGGYKGAGLAFMFSILAGALVGAHYGTQVNNTNVGHLLMVIDVACFCDPHEFKDQVARAVAEMKNSKKADGTTEIFVPGERSFHAEEENKKKGIPLSSVTIESLVKLAYTLHITHPF